MKEIRIGEKVNNLTEIYSQGLLDDTEYCHELISVASSQLKMDMMEIQKEKELLKAFVYHQTERAI